MLSKELDNKLLANYSMVEIMYCVKRSTQVQGSAHLYTQYMTSCF